MNWFQRLYKQAGPGETSHMSPDLWPDHSSDFDGLEVVEYFKKKKKKDKNKNKDKYNVLEEREDKPEFLEFDGTFVGA